MQQISPQVAFLLHLAKAEAVLSSRFNGGCLGSLTFHEFLALLHIEKEGSLGIRRMILAKKIGLSASGVTRLLAPMEKIHLISTDETERDARVRLVKITEAGKERLTLALDQLEAMSETIVPVLDKKTLQSFSEFLLLLTAKAEME